MIEVLTDLPLGVVGFRAHGKITKKDYREVLVPSLEGALVNSPHVRLLYELAPDFTGFEVGAMWEDLMLAVEHPTAWKAVAMVSDKKWVQWITRTVGVIMPCPVRTFTCDQIDEARKWITSAPNPA
jgi:hypothetical protein